MLQRLLPLVLALAMSGAWAQSYPAKPVRIIVPFGPGGPDALARLLGAPLTKQVENAGIFVAVNPGVPARTPQELIELARRPDSKLSFGSPGVGNTLHLAGELFNNRAGTHLLHIPYKGAGPAVAAAISGETQVMFSTPPAILQQLKAGRLRALAYTDAKRHPQMPDVPTATEAGMPSFQHHGGWFGMFAPAGTPPEILSRVHAEVRTAFANALFRERLETL